MNAAFRGLVDPSAFEFVDAVPDDANVVSARWLFAKKVDKYGNLVNPKVRLVVSGFCQMHATYTRTPAASNVLNYC